MANPLDELLKKFTMQQDQEQTIPYAPSVQPPNPEYNQLAQAEAVEQEVVPAQLAPAKAPAPVAPNIPTAPELPEAPAELSVGDKLTKLMAERNAAYADAEKNQRRQELIAGLSANIGNIVGGAQAMNTGASVTPAKTGFTAQDLTSSVDKRYKPELDTMMSQYKALQAANKPMTEYQRLMLAHMGKQLDQSALNSNRAMDRYYGNDEFRDRKQTWTEKEKDELSPTQAKEFKSIDTTIDSLDKIEGMKDFSTGPIRGRMEKALRFAGKGSPERTALQAQLNMATSAYGNTISGTAVGEQEFKRIEAQLPNENDSDADFAAKLTNFKQTMEDSRLRMLDTYRRSGKNVESLKDRPSIESLRGEKTGGMVTIKAPSGQTKEVTAENAAEYLKRPGYSKVK